MVAVRRRCRRSNAPNFIARLDGSGPLKKPDGHWNNLVAIKEIFPMQQWHFGTLKLGRHISAHAHTRYLN
jgi:hypothetical protein